MTSSRPITLPPRFAIDCEIGRGGMAVVYRAHDTHLDRLVAIKVLSSGLSDTVGTERFQREVALMAKLVHPGIVALFDSGVADGCLYYVMPFVSGETLRARLVRERRLAPPDCAALGADVAEALAYAHGLGIVHRDVKPENIFTVAGRAILADFGIARVRDLRSPEENAQTTVGTILGTLAYMSPEQASGETQIDGRADLYSLGCTLYELLTGEPPFSAPTFMGMLAKHMTEAPRPPSERGVALSPEFETYVLQLLAKDPAQRPANAGEVARVLRAFSHSRTSARAASVVAPMPLAPMAAEMIAVGPIAVPAGDAECGPVASALSRAIASTLCTVPSLQVTDAVHGEGARVLTVDGSVRRSSHRVRVTMRVLDADGTMQWSRHTDGTLDDLFTLEDAVADSVKEHFVERATRQATARAGAPAVEARATTEADRLVAAGLKAFARRSGASSLEEAKAYLTRALALEPQHARGLCAMGNVWSVAAVTGLAPREEGLARGREMIFSALAADDQCAEVHCSLGKLALYHDDDFHAASRHVRRAAKLDPADPEALRLLSIVYKILGRSSDSVGAAQSATARFPDAPPLWNTLGDALLAAGRNAEAVDALKHAIRLMPSNALALERLELARTRLGEFDLAVEIRVTRLKLAGHHERVALLEQNVVAMGAAEAIRADVRRELEALLDEATRTDPFADHVDAAWPIGLRVDMPNWASGDTRWTGSSGRTSVDRDACVACSPTCRWTIGAWPPIRDTRDCSVWPDWKN